MKNILTFIFAIFTCPLLISQENLCESSYMPFEEGTLLEMTYYDKKGKVASITEQKVSELTETPDGFKATLEFTNKDKKGNESYSGSFYIECRGESVYMDMSNMFDQQQLAGMKDMEVEMTGEDLEIPNHLVAGQELPDSKIEIKTSVGGFGAFNMTMNVINRKVEGMETITTPAGTFDCARISQETKMKTITTITSKSINWYAKGIGVVRMENYDHRDRLTGTMELTKLEN